MAMHFVVHNIENLHSMSQNCRAVQMMVRPENESSTGSSQSHVFVFDMHNLPVGTVDNPIKCMMEIVDVIPSLLIFNSELDVNRSTTWCTQRHHS
jgi:hypothetical protein